MRTYVSTMGYHETRVTRPLLRHGLADEDSVVLLRPATETDTNRGSNAVDYVKDMLHEIAPDASIVVETIDESEFETAVLECSDVLRAASGALVVNFGGGAREIFLPLTIAAISHATEIESTLQYTDVEQSVREWTVPNLGGTVPPNAWPTLETVVEVEDETSIPDLDDRLDASKSTISRHVSDLETQRFVETTRRGKTKYVSATLAGKLRVRRRVS